MERGGLCLPTIVIAVRRVQCGYNKKWPIGLFDSARFAGGGLERETP